MSSATIRERPTTYSVQEVAEILDVSTEYVRRLAREGLIPCLILRRDGCNRGVYRIPCRRFERWLDQEQAQ